MGGRHLAARPRVRAESGSAAVRQCLQSYADRGVFRGYTEHAESLGRLRFRFSWLARDPYDLRYEAKSGTFTFLNVLPNVPGRSQLARALRTFVAGRSSSALPPHRWIDPRRATASAFVERSALRLRVVAKRRHHGYAANRLVNLMHEVYVYLQSYYPEYLWENYGLSED